MNQFIPNLLETRPFLTERLVDEWRYAYHPEDWAFIRGMLSTLHLLEDNEEDADDLLLLFTMAGYFLDEARAKRKEVKP